METDKNSEKYEIYRAMNINLSRAFKAGFYYEAIFIEYAILEDRLASLLKYAGIPYADKNGKDISINQKINKAESAPPFSIKFVRDRISIALLDSIRVWTKQRNDLIHHLATMPYNHQAIKQLAEEGYALVKLVSNKVKSVNNYHKKQL